jgi:hypothetical protein
MATEAALVLDARSFNSAERLEVQIHFDTPFGDLLQALFEAVDPRREGPSVRHIVARDGTRFFPDQVIAFCLWVQAKRDRPDAELAEFDDLALADLVAAHVGGLMGKGGRSTRPARSSPEPASSGSSEAA